MTQTKTQNQPEIFIVWSDEIKGRIDPSFYRPEFRELEKIFIEGKYEIKTFKQIAEKISSGATPKSGGSDYTIKEKGIPFIRSGDINADKIIDFENLLYVKKEIHEKKLKSSQLKKGDVLIAIVGATIGQVSLYDYNKEANINQAIALVRVKKDINPEYVKEYLLCSIGQNQLNKIKRPVARANINLNEIGSIKIPIPPLEIQNKIVSIMSKAYEGKKKKWKEAEKLLNSIDDYVLKELKIKMPEIKKEMIFEIWSDEVKGRIDPSFYRSEFKELNKILTSVKTVKFSELINSISMGASIPKYKEEKNEVPFVFGKNVKHGFLDLNNLEYISQETCQKFKSSILKENDLVFSVRGVYIGKVAKIPKELEGGNIINNLVRINLKDEKLADYLTIYLSSKIGQALINREVWGGAQPGITNEQIKNLKIPLPPIQIQNKIVEKVNLIYKKSQILKKEAGELLEEAKQKVENLIKFKK